MHSACQRGKQFGENGAKPGRVDRKMAFCAFCVSTRQWRPWSLVWLQQRYCGGRKTRPGDSVRMGGQGASRPSLPLLTPAPPTVSCVPASRELVSGGPLPLPSSGGGQATRAGLPTSAVPLPLPYVMNTECFQPVYRRRWRHKTSQVGKMLSTCNARTHQCPICVAGRTKNVHLRRDAGIPATRPRSVAAKRLIISILE